MAISNSSGVYSLGGRMAQGGSRLSLPAINVEAEGVKKRTATVKKIQAEQDKVVIETPVKKEYAPVEVDQTMSMGQDFDAPLKGIEGLTAETKKQDTDYKAAKTALSGAQFMVDVYNANNAYTQVAATAQLNILQARNQQADALYRGRQAALDAQSEGYQAGQSALLNAAAQGQDVNGAQTQKIQGSYEAIGYYNAAQEEINSMREALGYELEEVNYGYQVRAAEINKNYAVLGSALQFGASVYGHRST